MKSLIALSLTLFLALQAVAETTRVVVIDTGINKHKFIPGKNGLCETGHLDLTNNGMDDESGHGTNIAGIIHKEARNSDYCQILVKFYTTGIGGMASTMNMVYALRHALSLKPDIVNISAGGSNYSLDEHNAVKDLLDAGITVVAAAGNDGLQLNSMYCKGQDCAKYNFYPAGYDSRVLVVGASYANGDILPGSNYGELVDVWRLGFNVEGVLGGIPMSGTSQAAATFTGEYVRRISKNKK